MDSPPASLCLPLPLLFCAPLLSNFILFIAGLFLLELLPVRVMFRLAYVSVWFKKESERKRKKGRKE